MQTKTFIYKITNRINGKIYVGKTTSKSPLNRWAKHLSTAKHKTTYNHVYRAIHKALNKYGKDNFTFEIIEECDLEEYGLGREKFWIKHYESFGPKGYNLTEGGDGSSGFKHSQESKDKMSKARKGKRLGKENTFYGKHHSQKTKRLISKARKGSKLTNEDVMKRSKLKVNDVLQIRRECDNCPDKKSRTAKYKELVLRYGVSIETIRAIYNRERWGDLK